MKGIVLAGGSGTRLYPVTLGISKQLIPIFDKPMIYYPISVLMLAGIKDILIITTREDQSNYIRCLGDGRNFGINLTYATQDNPNGVAEAFIIGKDFIGNDRVALALGDNIFWGSSFVDLLRKASSNEKGATVFGYQVKNPECFGVIEFDNDKKVIGIEEKPKIPKSNFAVTGLYFYDNNVIDIVKEILPSARAEIEITSINEIYLKRKDLYVELLGRGFAWLDTGNHQTLLQAANFVEAIESRQGYKIACLEEIGFKNGWLTKERLQSRAELLKKTSYGQYLIGLGNENDQV